MSMKEPRASRASQDWSVVFQSIPSKFKNEVGKQIESILGLDRRDAKAILTNAPLVFLDNLSFELAVRIKIYFQKLGVVVEVTNHDIIKKNCSQVSWPKTPDLSFFALEETMLAVPQAQNEIEKRESVGTLLTRTMPEDSEMTPETQMIYVTPLPAKPHHEFQTVAPRVEPPHSDIDAELELRAQEMGERFRTLHEEKQALQTQHEEAINALKNESQRRVAEEKKRGEEIAKVCEDLRQEVEKYKALANEDEALRSETKFLDEKVRELEIALKEKNFSVELLIQQKDELTRQAEKTAKETDQELVALRAREMELSRKIEGLEQTVQQVTVFLRTRDGELAQAENRRLELEAILKKNASALELLTRQKEEFIRQAEKSLEQTHQELASLRNREPELLRTIDGLEKAVHQTAETLHTRENELARSGKHLLELETTLRGKTSEVDSLMRQRDELAKQSGKTLAEAQQELAALRNREPELLRKVAGLEQTVQQMNVSLRTRDNALAQYENRLLEVEAVLKKKHSDVEFLTQEKEALDRRFRKASADTEEALSILKNRELELLKQIANLDKTVQKMTASLRSRDIVLAQFEAQVTKLIEMSGSSPKRPPRF
ncbi:MAG: hypothetical protein V1882_12470 [Candidatus Omnitrophota bacterium]